MVFKVKERYSLHRENVDCLLKYDLNSSVTRDPSEFDISFPVEAIGNAFYENVLVDCSDLYRLKYVIGVDIKPLKEKMKSHIGFEYEICSNKRVDLLVYQFIEEYQERHLKYKEDTASTIKNYLSLCDMLHLDDFRRVDIFRFVLKVLVEAGVKDHSVCRKLFLFVKHSGLRRILLSSLETGSFVYLLENLCNRYDSNEYIWNNIDMIDIINYGRMDNLKVLLNLKSCIEFNPEDEQRSVRDFFDIGFRPNAAIFPVEYSSERLILLLQMACIIDPGYNFPGGSREKAIEALKLSWKTIPQAYFTREEMKDILERLFNYLSPVLSQSERQDIERKIQRTIEEYERIFDIPVMKPRSLKNYARIAVRKRCRTADTVDKLVPSKKMKAYIKLL